MNIAGGKVVKSILMAEDIANILPALVKRVEFTMCVILGNLHSGNYQNLWHVS